VAIIKKRDVTPEYPLDRDEIRGISQTVTSSGIKYSKSVRVFSEQGVVMLSSVLNSNRAIQVNFKTTLHGGNTP
jgi:hypothetical protein